jgi:hypothetical protein
MSVAWKRMPRMVACQGATGSEAVTFLLCRPTGHHFSALCPPPPLHTPKTILPTSNGPKGTWLNS